MKTSTSHLYNPFLNSYLGSFVEDGENQGNKTRLILEQINLYHQPVPDPMIAGIFCGIFFLMYLLAVYLHLKVWAMLKKDGGILKNITRIFIVAQMTLCTVTIGLVSMTNVFHTFPGVITDYFCPSLWYILYLTINIFGFHSFNTALMRYCFIVHTDKVNSMGKEKVKRFFECMSVLIPLLLTTLTALEGLDLDAMSFVNKCYNEHHEAFLRKKANFNVVQTSICDITNYDSLKGYDRYLAIGKRSFCLVVRNVTHLIMLIMGSNLSEGFIYYRLFTYMQK